MNETLSLLAHVLYLILWVQSAYPDGPLPRQNWPALKLFARQQELWRTWHGWGPSWEGEVGWARWQYAELRDAPRLADIPSVPDRSVFAQAQQDGLLYLAGVNERLALRPWDLELLSAREWGEKLYCFWADAETATNTTCTWHVRRSAAKRCSALVGVRRFADRDWPPPASLWYFEHR